MNELDALRMMVQHFPGGRPVVAMRLGKSDEVLRKELSGTDAKFKLGLHTAMAISELCIEAGSENCRAFVSSVATASGGFLQLPVREMDEPVSIQKSMSAVVRELSDVTTATLEAEADGVMSDNDLRAVQKEIAEARAALQRLEQAARTKNEAGKPSGLRAA